MKDTYPKRIICLTDEVTEWLYMLGEEHRIVGISAFAERPERAKKEKPMVCGFTGANFKKILGTKPDLVIGFSDLQADIAARLIKEGIPTLITNQRSIQEIMETLGMIARMIGAEEKAKPLLTQMFSVIDEAKSFGNSISLKPKVYFEEWNEPLITGIKWVSEIIEICGGEDVFIENAEKQSAQERVLADFSQVIDKNPDIGLFCWCGKKFEEDELLKRENIQEVPFIKTGNYQEIEPLFMLQPGPASILEGIPFMMNIIKNWTTKN